MKTRNYIIDFIKVVFAVIIACGHFGTVIINNGLIVNLFFVISGYFIVKSANSNKYSSTWNYTFSRLKRIYPYYLFAFVIMLISNCIQYGQGIYDTAMTAMKSLPEIFLLQNVGIYAGGINYPLWFLCDCIIASHIMFTLLKWNKQVTKNVISPLVALAGITYMIHSGVDIWGIGNDFIAMPLLRAFTYLALGIAVYDPVNKVVQKICAFTNRKCMDLVMLVYGIICVVLCYVNRNDYNISLITFILLFIFCLYPSGIVYKICQLKVFKYCEKMSLAIFLNHAMIISWLRYRGIENSTEILVIYIIGLFVYCAFMLKIVDYITIFIRKVSNKYLRCQKQE